MLELVLLLALLVGVPVLVVAVVTGSAAYVRDGAERELERLAADGSEPDRPATGERQAARADERDDDGSDDA
ncbi:hypothetical protein [Halovivax cerinus]|uniref:Uncharacterized protein n=1 Tax=Halovivax cerinus TaxID=1487865 RepID=A0ABD5NMB1_9EURY|nr:hypothetical protein [Halovivax cerinus]